MAYRRASRFAAGEFIVPNSLQRYKRLALDIGELLPLYGRRFTIEENFRDSKVQRFAMGLSATHVGRTDRINAKMTGRGNENDWLALGCGGRRSGGSRCVVGTSRKPVTTHG